MKKEISVTLASLMCVLSLSGEAMASGSMSQKFINVYGNINHFYASGFSFAPKASDKCCGPLS